MVNSNNSENTVKLAVYRSISEIDECSGAEIILASKAKLWELLCSLPSEYLEPFLKADQSLEYRYFGENMKRKRKSLGYTLKGMEAYIRTFGLKLSYSEISDIENGKRERKYGYPRRLKLSRALRLGEVS